LVSAARATAPDDALARSVERYNALCLDPKVVSPALIADFADSMRAAGLTFGGKLQCRSLRPAFITKERLAVLRDATRVIVDALELVEEKALEDRSFARSLGLSDAEIALAAIDPGYSGSTAVSRLDMYFDDEPDAIEYNADSPAGMAYEAGQARIAMGLPPMQRFAAEQRVDHLPVDVALREALLSVWHEFRERRAPHAPTSPTIAIVDMADAPTTAEFHLVARDLNDHGIAAIVASPDDLRYDGAALFVGGTRVHMVYRRLLVSDFLARYGLDHPLAAAYRHGGTCVASSFRCKIAHKKLALAAIVDEYNPLGLSDSQCEVLYQLIPPTIRLTESNRAVALMSQQLNVLKPNDSYGGRGVVVGWECSADEWRSAIDAATDGEYVLQIRAMARYEMFPIFDPDAPETGVRLERLLVDCNPFVFRDGELGGLLTRLSPTAIVNVARGGQAVPTFVVG
jgi:hypothetical protein